MNYSISILCIFASFATSLSCMDKMLTGYVNGALGYATRQLNPTAYATDATNQPWAQNLAKETQEKSISQLNALTIKHGTKEHPYAVDISKRALDKVTAILQILVPASLAEDSANYTTDTLATILKVNPLLIPDLHYLLALKALEAQQKQPLLKTKCGVVDVLLHKIAQLPYDQQRILLSSLLASINPVAQTSLLTDSLTALSDEQLDALVVTIKAKKAAQVAPAATT